MRFVTDAQEFVKNWVYRKIGAPPPKGWYTTIAAIDDAGKLMAACVYLNYHGHDIEMVFAAEHPKWATRTAIRNFFWYPFMDAKCIRVTACIAKDNKRSRRMVAGLGFKQEGCVRHGIKPGTDAIIYGLLASECAWIRPRSPRLNSGNGRDGHTETLGQCRTGAASG